MGYITWRLGLLGILCAFACCIASAAGFQVSSHDGGIKGRVMLHNPYVVVRSTNATQWISGSTTPFHASFRVYSFRSGKLITSFTTYAPGRFRVSLPPGQYRVVPETMWRGRVLQPGMIVLGHTQSARPFNVRVHPWGFTPVAVTYEESMGY